MTAFRLGLTGSIGMGKSTTAGFFAEAGIPVWDADAAVRRLYEPGGPAALAIGTRYPGAIGPNGGVLRPVLRDLIRGDPAVLDWLNSTVHPLTTADRTRFLQDHADAPIVLLDIPLLYETGADAGCDAVVVVSAPAATQRARVLARGEMSEADFQTILARQLPDAEKRLRADYLIETTTLEAARAAVKDVLTDIRRKTAQHA
jgi:dephospho-CoA kinase